MMHEHFSTNIKHEAIYALQDLFSVKLKNDNLRSFISNWDQVIAGIPKVPEVSVLRLIFHDWRSFFGGPPYKSPQDLRVIFEIFNVHFSWCAPHLLKCAQQNPFCGAVRLQMSPAQPSRHLAVAAVFISADCQRSHTETLYAFQGFPLCDNLVRISAWALKGPCIKILTYLSISWQVS